MAIKQFGDVMVWEELVAEGYCVLNPDCKVAHATSANTNLDVDDVVAYARLAENYFKLPIFYTEEYQHRHQQRCGRQGR